MSEQPLRPEVNTNNEEVDVKQKSLFARLKKLFSSGVVVRNVGGKKLKVKDTSDLMYATDRNSLRDRFNRVRSTSYNAYTRDFSLAYQAARIDLFRDYDCVGPDTVIPLPDGTYPTIKELTEKYKNKPQERFYVFSYDHKTDSIKLGKAFHPRKKKGGERLGYKVTFDDGQYVIGSIKHPFLMRNGEYKMIFDLKVGDSVMPFNSDWGMGCVQREYDYRFYRSIFSDDNNTNKIKSIECIGPIEVYDITVEEYHNFATDSCLVRNTMDMDPIIACLSSTTYVSTLKGFVTIKDLCDKYSNGESFEVWSWDKDNQKLTIGNAHHPRKTGTKNVIEVHLDNGEILKCTSDHRIMLIDGTYKEAGQLLEGESLMPFYHRVNKHSGYTEIKSLGKRYKKAHRYIFEDVFEQDIGSDNIHHKNHVKLDNRTVNLERLTALDHCKLHGISPITNGNRKESGKKLWLNEEYREKCLTPLRDWQSSEEGKKFMSEHTSLLDKNRWKNDVGYVTKMTQIFSNHAKSLWNDSVWKEWKRKKHSETIRMKYANDPSYAEKTKHVGKENGRYNPLITTESVLAEGIKYNDLIQLAKNFDFKGIQFKNDHSRCQFLHRRLKEAGYNGWIDYKNKFVYSNHKVVKIVNNNEIEDVYDLTVDHFENFALKQGIIVSNSALDIYADESLTVNELGKVLVVHAEDENIKGILTNLFYDVLNIEHNLWSWTRNTAKYGDFYMRLYISPEYGVYQIEPISAYNVERLENTDPLNKNYVKFQIRPTDTSQVETLEFFECAHFRLLSDSNFLPYGKCVVSDTHIDTEFGSKYIKDINVGELIWSFNIKDKKMELTKVLNKVCSGKKKTIKICTQHNFVNSSKDHKFLIFNTENKNIEYKIAENIKVGDLLVLNSNINKKSQNYKINKIISEDKTCPSNKPTIDNIPEYVNEEFCEFMGFMMGDGWIRKYPENYRVCFSLGIDETQNQKYINLLKKYSGKDPYIAKTGSRETKSRAAVVYSKYLYEILYNNGLTNKSAKEKRIPLWVFELPTNLQHFFILGLGNADGWSFTDKWNSKHYSISLCNKDLIYDFKKLLQFSNIKTSIPKEDDVEEEVIICGNECVKHGEYSFYYYLDGLVKEQMEKYNFINNENIFLEPVRKIEDGGEKETWDIQVESSNSNFIANGLVVHNSMIEGARRVWKQLSLMEDAMLIHRIMRAPEKRIFKLDVGNIPPNEIDNFMEKAINKQKKVPYVDPQTGDYNLKFNLQNMTEDFWIPVRGSDSGTSIETLSGMEFTGIDDIEYLRNKLMAALKIPKAFLGYEEELSGKATLASEDVRFARTIQRIQRIIVSELEKVAIVHLYSQGYRDESLINFKLELTNPSTIFEKEKIEVWSNKTELAKNMMETKIFSKPWIYKNVFNLSKDDFEELSNQIVDDSKQIWRFKSIEEEGNDPAKPFEKINPKGDEGGGGMPPSDMGGGPPLDLEPGGPGAGGLGGAGAATTGAGLPSLEESKDKLPVINNKPTGSMDEGHGEHADDYVRPPQDGEKNARRDYPFGEDPLGNKENNEKPRKTTKSLTPKFSKKSPLSLETLERSNFIKNLSSYLDKSKPEKKELIKEAKLSGSKSILDESQIITDE